MFVRLLAVIASLERRKRLVEDRCTGERMDI
jgi:hypothetical protein